MAPKRRDFLKLAGITGAGLALYPLMGCGGSEDSVSQPEEFTGPFTLPGLGYEYSALEPFIDAETMEIHHSRHHQGYVANLNKAIGENSTFNRLDLEAICASVKPDETAIRNNSGGHWNHSRFWKWISPGGAKGPGADLEGAITADFGSREAMLTELTEAAKSRFGSGWAWVSLGQDGKLFISSTPNQDNPLMREVAERTGTPIVGIDVWEHAYYLKYQNRRPDYIQAMSGLINWDVVTSDYLAAVGR